MHLFIIAILVVFNLAISYGVDPYNWEIQQYVDESKRSQSMFEAFDEKLSRFSIAPAQETYGNRDETLQAYQVLKNYPTVPSSHQKIYAMVLDGLPSIADTETFVNSYLSLGSPGTLTYLTHARALIRGSEAYELTFEEQREVAESILNHIKKELSQPTSLLSLLSNLVLIQDLIDFRLVSLTRAEQNYISNLRLDAKKLKDDLARLTGKEILTDRESLNLIVTELGSTEALRLRLLKSVNSLRI